MRPEKYCKRIVKESGSNFYYAFLFLAKRKRRAIYAIYALSRVIDDIVDSDADLDFKEKLLKFWREEIDACFDGVSEHPMTKELIYATKEFHIPKKYLLDLLAGVTQDMVQTRYATFEDLEKYCYRVASVVGLMCTRIFEVEDTEKNREAAINLGLAFQLTNILRDVGVDADIDRIYLPEEDLIKFGVTEEEIINKDHNERFKKMMAYEWVKADELFKKALGGFSEGARKKLLPALIMADIYYEILNRIKIKNYKVFEEKVRVSNPEKLKMAIKRWLRR